MLCGKLQPWTNCSFCLVGVWTEPGVTWSLLSIVQWSVFFVFERTHIAGIVIHYVELCTVEYFPSPATIGRERGSIAPSNSWWATITTADFWWNERNLWWWCLIIWPCKTLASWIQTWSEICGNSSQIWAPPSATDEASVSRIVRLPFWTIDASKRPNSPNGQNKYKFCWNYHNSWPFVHIQTVFARWMHNLLTPFQKRELIDF